MNPSDRSRALKRRSRYETFEERLALSAQAIGDFALGLDERLEHHYGELAQIHPVDAAQPLPDFQLDSFEQQLLHHTGDLSQQLNEAHELTGVDDVVSDYGFTGVGQTVAIIDSGIAWDHVALGGGFGSGSRVVGGYDFAENDSDPYDDGPSGFHGTHVAGIVGSSDSTYRGVASEVDLIGLRVFDDNGDGYFSWVESALQWVHDHRNDFANPITTVNLSLGTDWNSDSIPSWANLEEEFAQLEADGMFITVSAGNSFQDFGQQTGLSYPAASPYVVPVASVDGDGSLSYFSQRNSRVIAAPGRNIASTVPDYVFGADGNPNDFGSASGTSMAAPYAAGASMLVREAMSFVGIQNITQDAIYDHFRDTADVVYDAATNADYFRINVQAAIDALMPDDDYGSSAGEAHSLGTLSGNSTVSGLIGTLDDADYFTFTAGATGTMSFSVDATHALTPNCGLVDGEFEVEYNTMTFDVEAGGTYTLFLQTADGIGFYDASLGLEETTAPSDDPALATGMVTTSAGAWTTVTLDDSYDSMVVVGTANYDTGDDPGVVRIQNASGNSFQVQVVTPGGGTVSGVDVYYMVVEEGVYNEAEHGVTMEAVKVNSTITDRINSWSGQSQDYVNSYTDPVVFGQVMTANDANWSVFWSRGSTRASVADSSSLYVGKHIGEDTDAHRDNETIGYVVFETGTGTIGSTSFEVALGGDHIRGIDESASAYSHNLSSVTTAIVTQSAMDGGQGSWAVLWGDDPLSDGSLDVVVDEDQIRDLERKHTSEQVAYILFDDGTAGNEETAPSDDPALATGMVTTSAGAWTTVTLDDSYDSMVVVGTANYDTGDDPGVVRIQNASGNSFQVQVVTPGGGTVSGVDVYYMVVEEGVYNEAEHGVTMEAVKVNSTITDRINSWSGQSQDYVNSYTDPVVFGQVMTANDANWSVFWSRGSTRASVADSSSLYVGKHIGEDTDAHRDNETIGYVVFETGTGTIGSTSFEVALGGDHIRGIDESASAYSHNLSSVTTAIVTQSAMDGGQGSWAVLWGDDPLSDGSLDVVVDEDQIRDLERKHTSEQVAYILFDDGTGSQGDTQTNELVRLAAELDQQLGLAYSGGYHADWAGLGEKWMNSASGQWYFIKPSGELHQWNGSQTNAADSPLVGTFDSTFHADPSKLHDAPAPAGLGTTITVSLNTSVQAEPTLVPAVSATAQHRVQHQQSNALIRDRVFESLSNDGGGARVIHPDASVDRATYFSTHEQSLRLNFEQASKVAASLSGQNAETETVDSVFDHLGGEDDELTSLHWELVE
jgi:subtilisin family serine protease